MPPQAVFESCKARQLRFKRSINFLKRQFAFRSPAVPIISAVRPAAQSRQKKNIDTNFIS
jgi:hypothetical protein